MKLEVDLSELNPNKLINNEQWLKAHTIINLKSVFDNKLNILSVTFETKAGFLLNFTKSINERYNIYIIHNPQHINEVLFYIKSIKKLKL
jgi:hypothetical protein